MPILFSLAAPGSHAHPHPKHARTPTPKKPPAACMGRARGVGPCPYVLREPPLAAPVAHVSPRRRATLAFPLRRFAAASRIRHDDGSVLRTPQERSAPTPAASPAASPVRAPVPARCVFANSVATSLMATFQGSSLRRPDACGWQSGAIALLAADKGRGVAHWTLCACSMWRRSCLRVTWPPRVRSAAVVTCQVRDHQPLRCHCRAQMAR